MRFTTVIEPQSNYKLINFKELKHYKDLFIYFVRRDIKSLYAQTILGFSWAIIRPVFSMLVFTIVFGRLANVPSDGAPYAVFSYTALLPWTYFSTALTGATTSLVSNAQVLTKVYFPRIFIPLTPIIAGLLDFFIASIVLAALMVYYGITPSVHLWVLPILLLLMIVSSAGIGFWLSALAIQYRDVRYAMQFLTQILMYAAPVVWPVSLIMTKFPQQGEIIRLLYGLYPMAGVIEGFRAVLLKTTAIPWDLIAVGGLSSLFFCISGLYYFKKRELYFADVA